MGNIHTNKSGSLPPVLQQVTFWPWQKVTGIVKTYNDEEHDFGIDASIVCSLTGFSMDESKTLINILSKNDNGIINAITLLITFASLAEGNKRILEQRLEMIFDLMDFDNSAQITVDETTILLLCVASSFSSILGKHDSCPNDQAMSKMTQAIYDSLSKKSSRTLLKNEFMTWASDSIAELPDLSIESIYDQILVSGVHGRSPNPKTPNHIPKYEIFSEESKSRGGDKSLESSSKFENDSYSDSQTKSGKIGKKSFDEKGYLVDDATSQHSNGVVSNKAFADDSDGSVYQQRPHGDSYTSEDLLSAKDEKKSSPRSLSTGGVDKKSSDGVPDDAASQSTNNLQSNPGFNDESLDGSVYKQGLHGDSYVSEEKNEEKKGDENYEDETFE